MVLVQSIFTKPERYRLLLLHFRHFLFDFPFHLEQWRLSGEKTTEMMHDPLLIDESTHYHDYHVSTF